MLRSLVALKSSSDNNFTFQRNLPKEALEKAWADGAIVWVDVYDGVDDDLPWLETQLDLHPVVVEDLHREDRRPTLLVYPEYIFLSLFQPQIRLKKVYAHEIHCLIGDNFFVTVRRSEANPVDEAYNRISKDEASWELGTAYFLFLTIQFVVDAYYPLLDKIGLNLDDLESTILAGGTVPQQALYHIKYELITL